jgi:ubiquinone/menaquinone biosynthesis C-methylase UbiE
MHLMQSLDASDLGISGEEIAGLFAPFVAEGTGEASWEREASRRKRKLLRGCLERMLLGLLPGGGRNENVVQAEYSQAWQGIPYSVYSLERATSGYTPWLWRGQKMLAVDMGATRVRQLLLARAIERLRPARVLEVGCGNGINLILLACRFPEIHFTGIELTEAGHRVATEFQREPMLPLALADYAPLPLVDPTGFRRVRFLQGNAARLPFEAGEFDLVYSSLALEQMEKIRDRALAEFARVTGQHALMIEPFRDVNASFWSRLYIFRRNYFRAQIADLKKFGLEPVLCTDDFPQELFLKACFVLSRKMEAERPADHGRRHAGAV